MKARGVVVKAFVKKKQIVRSVGHITRVVHIALDDRGQWRVIQAAEENRKTNSVQLFGVPSTRKVPATLPAVERWANDFVEVLG